MFQNGLGAKIFVLRSPEIARRLKKAHFDQGLDGDRFKVEQDPRALIIDAGGQTVEIQKGYGVVVVHKSGGVIFCLQAGRNSCSSIPARL